MMDLISFSPSSRVWVFQGNQEVPEDKVSEVFYRIQDFTSQWTSHQKSLFATGAILHQRFIVFVVDEERSGISGCGIDKATHFVQSLGHHLGIDFFDRQRYSYIKDDHVFNVSADEFRSLYESGEVDDDTMVFDNLVNTKAAFIDSWVKPIKDTWVKRVVLS